MKLYNIISILKNIIKHKGCLIITKEPFGVQVTRYGNDFNLEKEIESIFEGSHHKEEIIKQLKENDIL